MPPKKRTPSRGRPPGRRNDSQGRRAQSVSRTQSASRRVAANKATENIHLQQQTKQQRTREIKSKSPSKKKVAMTPTATVKVTPSGGGTLPTRKIATEPATHRSRSPARTTRQSKVVNASFIGKGIPNSHGTAHVSAVTVSSSSTSFSRTAVVVPPSSPSPVRHLSSYPQLRSRTITKHMEQQQKVSPKERAMIGAKGTNGWQMVEALKATPGAIGRQMGKLLRGGPRPLLNRTGAHLRRHWHFWLLLLMLLLFGAFLVKFQREVLVNVQQMRKQLVDFVNEQYEQKRQIFGDQWQRAMETMEWAHQKYLTDNFQRHSPLPAGSQPQIPPASSSLPSGSP